MRWTGIHGKRESILHLAGIGTPPTQGAHAMPAHDAAGWHRLGRRLQVPGDVTLPCLPPPAAPECWSAPRLKPMETVRDHLRQNRLCTRVRNSGDGIAVACQGA